MLESQTDGITGVKATSYVLIFLFFLSNFVLAIITFVDVVNLYKERHILQVGIFCIF